MPRRFAVRRFSRLSSTITQRRGCILCSLSNFRNPLLSGFLFDIPVTGTYALGVTFCCDYDFDGIDPGQGAPYDEGRYVMDVFEFLP